jgi:hypothetical protein
MVESQPMRNLYLYRLIFDTYTDNCIEHLHSTHHFDKYQSGRFTSPRSTLHKSYVFCTTLLFCYAFYASFSLSPFSFVLEHCAKYIVSIQRCKLSMHFLQRCKKRGNIAHFACVLCNILRPGRMGTMKRLYITNSKIAKLYKIHRIECPRLNMLVIILN